MPWPALRDRGHCRGRRLSVIAAWACASVLAAPAGADASPALQVASNHAPATVPAGTYAKYTLRVSNTGNESTNAPLTLDFHAPPGLEITKAGSTRLMGFLEAWQCSILDPVNAVCEDSLLYAIGPGEEACQELEAGPCAVEILVKTKSTAALGELTPNFELCGGAEVACISGSDPITVGAPPALHIVDFDGSVLKSTGEAATQAGSHPFAASVGFSLNTVLGANGLEHSFEDLRNAVVDLPPGLIENPREIPTCSAAQLAGGFEANCPPQSRLGTATVMLDGDYGTPGSPEPMRVPVYNVVAPYGRAAVFGSNVLGSVVHLYASLRPGDYGFTVSAENAPQVLPFAGVNFTFWGVPADPGHDGEREGDFLPPATPLRAFLSLPGSCVGPIRTGLTVTTWQGGKTGSSFLSHDTVTPEPSPIAATACNALDFSPSMKARPTTNVADAPSGLDVDLHIPQASAEANPAGKPYSCTGGEWSNGPTGFGYQWLRNGAPIEDATSNSYLPQSDDLGAVLQCLVTASNTASGSSLAAGLPFFAQPAPVVPLPIPSSPPKVKGLVTSAGGTLSCELGSWQGQPSFAYQWYRSGSPLAGQTHETYEAAPGEAPATFQCEVFATNAAGTATAFSANLTSMPAPSPALANNTGLPVVSISEAAFPLSSAELKDAAITLPEGLVVNPSGANGLAGCTLAELGLQDSEPARCPDASRLGNVEADTPLLDHPIKGSVYIAEPIDNPFASLLALYLAFYDPATDTSVKLAGRVDADPATGRLTATFAETPQLPFEDLELHLFGGSGGVLRTPPLCGSYVSTSSLIPWSFPDSGPPASPRDRYVMVRPPGGGNCPTAEAELPNAPSLDAGTVSPIAGAYSPLVVDLRRDDGAQQLSSLDITLPPGLVGTLADVTHCSRDSLETAAARAAAAERASSSCPPDSRIGTVDLAAGAGPAPYNVEGDVYLTGSYRGSPLGLAIVIPALAGPFDLGTVVTRASVQVDTAEARLRIVSDPFPSVISGIPLDLRRVTVIFDRPGFIRNPTSCEPMSITSTVTSSEGNSVNLSNRFQVGDCAGLPFRPRVTLHASGGVARNGHPALRAVLHTGSEEAGLADISMTLPPGVLLDTDHIRDLCRPQLPPESCPSGSLLGYAQLWSPSLDSPLEGPIYLRIPSQRFPDLLVDLHADWLHFLLHGRTAAAPGGRLRVRFTGLPDLPLARASITLAGGRSGVLVNSESLCGHPRRAQVALSAQSGKRRLLRPRLQPAGRC